MSDARRQWPLVVFTVALQLACGLSIASALLSRSSTDAVAARALGMAIFPVVGVGLLFSALHLGRPLDAWKALLNLRRSRLSIEVLLTSGFALLAFAFSSSSLNGTRSIALGIATAIAGLATVISSASVYMLPTQPLWNRAWVPASFVGTALLLGGLAGQAFGRLFPLADLQAMVAIGSLLLIVSAIGMHTAWLRVATRHPGMPYYSRVWLCVLLTAFVPLVPFFRSPRFLIVQNFVFDPLAVFALTAALFGALLGRALMYSLRSTFPQF